VGIIWKLAIVLLIVVLIFGTKRLKSIGSDIGGAIKGFKQGMNDADAETEASQRHLESDDDDADFPERRKNKSRSA